MRHGVGPAADAGPADRQGDLLRGLVPRRLRDDPARARPTCRRSPRAVADLSAPSPASRRLGRRRPAPAALRRPGRPTRWPRRSARARSTEGWTLNVEREDVCPVVTLPGRRRHRDYLATLGKKERHEIRRKVRRAEAVGEIRLDRLDRPARRPRGVHRPPPEALGRRRPVPADRRAASRAASSSAGCSSCSARTARSGSRSCTVGGRRIAAGIHFETARRLLYYNAGVDPDARDLSPGVLMVTRYVRRALDHGHAAARLPARRRALQVRVGRGRRADPAPARPADATAPMSAPPAVGPCFEPSSDRRSPAATASASSRSSRPARTAAPRSTCTSLVTPDRSRPLRRLDRVALAGQRRPQARSAPAFDVLVIDEPDDAIAVGALAAHLADVRADVIHNHMYRAETRRHAGRDRPRARSATAGRTSSRPSTRAASAPRRTARCCGG